jgi:hypothetical protein
MGVSAMSDMTLAELAHSIRETQIAEMASHASALIYRVRAGKMLIEAKAKVKHGEWMSWVENNITLSHDWVSVSLQIANFALSRNLNHDDLNKIGSVYKMEALIKAEKPKRDEKPKLESVASDTEKPAVPKVDVPGQLSSDESAVMSRPPAEDAIDVETTEPTELPDAAPSEVRRLPARSLPSLETIHSLLGAVDPGADLIMLFKAVADRMDESTFEMAVEGVVGARGMKMIPRDTPIVTATMVDTHQPWTVVPALIEKMGLGCLESELKTAGYVPGSQAPPVVAPEARVDVPAEKTTSVSNPLPKTPDMAKSAIRGIIGLHRVTNVIGWIADLIGEDESKKAGMVKLLRKHAKQIASTVSKEALEEDVSEPTPSKRFVIPTIPQIEQEIVDKGYKNSDAEKFWNYYSSVDWKVGKSLKPMKNWQAALRNWNFSDFNDKPPSKPSFKAAPSPVLGKKRMFTAEQKRADLRRIYAGRGQEVPQSVLDAQKDDVDE